MGSPDSVECMKILHGNSFHISLEIPWISLTLASSWHAARLQICFVAELRSSEAQQLRHRATTHTIRWGLGTSTTWLVLAGLNGWKLHWFINIRHNLEARVSGFYNWQKFLPTVGPCWCLLEVSEEWSVPVTMVRRWSGGHLSVGRGPGSWGLSGAVIWTLDTADAGKSGAWSLERG